MSDVGSCITAGRFLINIVMLKGTMPHQVSPDWLDKTGFGVVGRFTLNGDEHLTAEIVDYNESTNEIIVEPISTDEAGSYGKRTVRAIEIDHVLSFDPEPRSSYAWRQSDPCRTGGFSLPRFTVLTILFLSATVGSIVLFITLMNREPYRLQELSAVSYTLSVAWLTFAAHREAPRFLFSCPAVKPKLSTLIRRHIGFLLALFLLQTAALSTLPRLPAWWSSIDSRVGTPFETVLLLLCFGLAIAEVHTNRSILKRAHSGQRI